MENLPEKVQQGTLLTLSSNAVAAFNTRCKVAIKIDHGIDGQSLVAFKSEYGSDTSLLLLARLVKSQSEFFNLVENISDTQAVDIATLMFEDYPNITVEDISVCFRYAKVGKPGYEKPMSRLDGRIVFNWLNQYLAEKYDRIEEIEALKSHDYKTEPISAETFKRFGDLFDKVTKKSEPVPEPIKPPMTFEKLEIYVRENISSFSNKQIRDLIKQFQSHHSCQAYDNIITFLQTEIKSRG